MVDCSHKQVISGVCIHCLHVLTPAAPPVPAAGSTRIESTIAFLRDAFHDDGAEGESVHLLCREVERMREQIATPRIRPCVAALVTDPAGRLLLVRTKRGWELPGGGLEVGETWRAGILRELREETGLDVTLDAGAPRVFDGMPVNGAQYQSLIVIARGTVTGDVEPRPEGGDAVGEARWFAANEVPLDGLSNIATAAIVREWVEAARAPDWTPPPGVQVEVLRGSPEGPLLVAHVRLNPGAEVPREVHADQSETIFPLVGRLEIEDGHASPSWQTEHDSAPVVIDPGVVHVVRNASATEPAEYIAILRRVATVNDTEPAPAPMLVTSLTNVETDLLRLSATHSPTGNHRAWNAGWRALENERHSAVLVSTADSLEKRGLLDRTWDITPAGHAALASLNAEER